MPQRPEQPAHEGRLARPQLAAKATTSPGAMCGARAAPRRGWHLRRGRSVWARGRRGVRATIARWIRAILPPRCPSASSAGPRGRLRRRRGVGRRSRRGGSAAPRVDRPRWHGAYGLYGDATARAAPGRRNSCRAPRAVVSVRLDYWPGGARDAHGRPRRTLRGLRVALTRWAATTTSVCARRLQALAGRMVAGSVPSPTARSPTARR